MWTTVPKPTDATYTNINAMGREQYDQASISFDDASVFYDGVDVNEWTGVAKPTDGFYITAGMATGLLIPLTYSEPFDASSWTKVSKPLN